MSASICIRCFVCSWFRVFSFAGRPGRCPGRSTRCPLDSHSYKLLGACRLQCSRCTWRGHAEWCDSTVLVVRAIEHAGRAPRSSAPGTVTRARSAGAVSESPSALVESRGDGARVSLGEEWALAENAMLFCAA